MAVNFQDEDKSGTEKVARNPNNFNILKGGKVDPRSKLYQRSLEGREKLSDYLNRLWNDGGDEADVFMAGVKSLMNRGHGYVGAYLDSKNPGRRYTDNQAKAIVDQVMDDEGIGEHPGARLTRPKAKDDSPEAKEKAKQAKASRKEANVARGSGPQQAPGRKAMPVGQQRKLGKRESTGQPLEDSRREGIGERDRGPVSEWQKTYEDWKKGEASTQDVLAAFQKQYQSKLSGSPQAKEEKQKARTEDRARETAAPEEAGGAAAPGGEFRPIIDPVGIREVFKEFYGKAAGRAGSTLKDHVRRVANTDSFSTDLEDIIDEIKGKGFDIDLDQFKKAVATSFGVNLDKYPGWDSGIKSQQPQEAAQPEQKVTTPEKANISKKDKEIIGTFADYFYDLPDSVRSPSGMEAATKELVDDIAEQVGISRDELVSTLSKDKNLADSLKKYGVISESQSKKVTEPEQKAAPAPEEQAPPKGQDQATTDPWEGEPPGPVKDVTKAPQDASREAGTKALPPARSPRPVSSKGGFRAGKQPTRQRPTGFGGTPNPKTVKEIMDVAKEEPPIEDFKTFLYNKQGDLFGKTGFDTESSATNPLEGGSTQPFPEGPEEIAPASQLPGSSGPTPRSVARGQEGQQSLFKMKDGQDTMEPRNDLKKGSKPKPTSKQPAPKKRTQAESQQIRKQGAEVLADVQTRNKLAEDMTRRIANSPVAQNEEMRDWINNDLERLLKSFTPAEKTEDPWEQDGPEPTGVPEPEVPAQQPQRALPGQPGPRGLLSPGKEPTAPRQGRTNPRKGRGENQPAKPSGRRTKAQGDEIRQRGQEVLEQIQSDARKGRELQQRMADSPAGSGEVPRSQREQEVTRRGQQALENEKPRTKKPIRDAVARALIGKGGKRIMNSAEYQEFAQSIRSMMR